ncbi:MAG TPA: hypothetical protein VIG50_03845 [Vicinamibacteria bacterium]|jgi:hypothetical protein
MTRLDRGLAHRRFAAAAVLLLLAARAEAAGVESSFGIALGYVKPKSIDATLWFNGDFRFHLAAPIALSPEFSYWKRSDSVSGVSTSLEDLHFGVNVLLVLRAGRTVELFAGGGGGLHHVTGDVAVFGFPAGSRSVTKPGVDALAGLDFRAGEGISFFLGARFDRVLELQDAEALDQWKYYGGFRLRF